MKKELNVVGLDCGHCALTLEKYIQSVKGVKECNVNFTTSKIYIDIEDTEYKKILKEIYKTAKQANPDVILSEEKTNKSNYNVIDIIFYTIGLFVGLFVILIKLDKFVYYPLMITALILLGYRTYWKAILQLRHLKINENTLITISIIGATLLGESLEGVMVIALYSLGKFLESKAVNYSRKSISKLISSQPEYANLYVDGIKKKVKPEVLNIGDLIVVCAGEKIPVDSEVVDGCGSVDKKHLTGESVPYTIKDGDFIEGGSILLDTTLVLKVVKEYKDSTVSKMINLITDVSNKKSKTESFISKFSSWYTLGVIISSIIVFALTWLILGNINIGIYRGLIFLVVSCPCAFAISVPLSYFSGIGRCSKEGILVKGSNSLDICSKIDRVIFDKTGTLTTGEFSVIKLKTKKKNLDFVLDIIYAGEKNSNHPIAKAICEYCGERKNIKISKFKEIAGIGVEFYYNKEKWIIGRSVSKNNTTVVSVVKNNAEIGKIYLEDRIKESSKTTINNLKNLKIKTMMLSGDNNNVSKKVANELNIDDYKSSLLPQDKFTALEELKGDGEKIAFVGDGINDGPALTFADVGISMGMMGSQATIECSDVVIADDNLNKITSLIKISKKTKKIVLQNIIFAGITKFTFLLLGALGITGMLFAVFADVGVTLLAILNSLRILSFKDK